MVPTKKIFENEIYIKKIKKLLDITNIQTSNYDNYLLAFVHRSLVNEKPDLSNKHNERLEFLWDAVLELIITSSLFFDYPNSPEWELTNLRSSLVKWKNLSKVAIWLWFDEYLVLWKWEETSGWRKNESLLANSVEAFIWAIYLDLWYEEAKKFIDKYIYSTLEDILKQNLVKDYKSLFQEEAQAKYFSTPFYEILQESWEDHNKIFTSGVFIKDDLIAKWAWTSKRKSQEDAAKNAYLKLFSNN